MRSLNVDSYRATRVALVVASLLMLALIAWFFFARVTLFETSQEVSFSEQGRLLDAVESQINSIVYPAYQKLIAYFTALEAKATDDDGVWKLPDGETCSETRRLILRGCLACPLCMRPTPVSSRG